MIRRRLLLAGGEVVFFQRLADGAVQLSITRTDRVDRLVMTADDACGFGTMAQNAAGETPPFSLAGELRLTSEGIEP